MNNTDKDKDNIIYKFSIDYYTNIPNGKEHRLTYKDIQYNDVPNNSGSSNDKFYYSNNKSINLESVHNKNDIKNILSNEKKFKSFLKDNYTENATKDNMKQIYLNYISVLFTTFPKPNNIKLITEMSKSHGIKVDNPFASNTYTYLNVNGTPHTVSRVIIYDDKKEDKINKTVLDEYENYKKWMSNTNTEKVVRAGIKNKIKELLSDNIKKYNIYRLFLKETTIEKTETNITHIVNMIEGLKKKKKRKETPSVGQTDIFLELESIYNDFTRIKDIIETNENIKNFNNTNEPIILDNSKIIVVIPLLKEIYEIINDLNISKSSSIIDKKLLSTQKITELKKLLKDFVEYAEIYEVYQSKKYDNNILNYDISGSKELKPFVKFLKMIRDKYNPNITFDLDKFEDMLNEGELYDVSKDETFDSDSIKIHIDLIKGKVNDENYKNVMCYYNDNDLKDRWDKLMSIKLDDEKFEYLPYFDIDNMDKSINNNKPEKIKDEKIKDEKIKDEIKGGKKTKRRTRKNNRKRRFTRRKQKK